MCLGRALGFVQQFGLAPCLALTTKLKVDADIHHGDAQPRTGEREPGEASPGQAAAQAFNWAARPLRSPCPDSDLTPTNISDFHSQTFNDWLKKPLTISALSICKSVLQR